MKQIKIDFISDIHVDFWIPSKLPQGQKLFQKVSEYVEDTLKPQDGDVLVIAGDIGHYFSQDTLVLKKLKEYYERIVIVRGNHDMYLVSKNLQEKYNFDSFSRTLEMKRFCNENEIYYLDGDSIDIKGFKFGGVGMWYNTPTNDDIEYWKTTMNDSNLIMKGRPYTVSYGYGARHKVNTFDTQGYYLQEVQKLKELSKKDIDVLVTHIIPTLIPEEKMPQQYAGDKSNMFYMSDNKEIVKEMNPELVIFGHTHIQYDMNIDGIQYVCNPLGYKSEKTNTSIQQIILYKD